MYDYDYEDEVLLILRLIKYLQIYEPGVFQIVLNELGEVDFDILYDNAFYIMEEVFDSPNVDPEMDEDDTCGMLYLEHQSLNEFLDLSVRYCALTGVSPFIFRQKIQDIILFHACETSRSVYDLEFRYDDMRLCVPIWYADSFDITTFSSGLADLVMYMQIENERLQAEIDALQSETETQPIWREVA